MYFICWIIFIVDNYITYSYLRNIAKADSFYEILLIA